MIIGYLRVSTGGQTVENQRLAIYDAGYKPDHWFEISASSRVPRQKRKIGELLDTLRENDTLVVTELSRLGRSTGQIAMLVDRLLNGKVKLHCLKENIRLDGSGKTNIQSKVMITMFSLFAEIERDLISERTREGIERARSEGKVLGRPKGIGRSKLDIHRADIEKWCSKGISVASISKLTGASWTTVNHYIKTRIHTEDNAHSA